MRLRPARRIQRTRRRGGTPHAIYRWWPPSTRNPVRLIVEVEEWLDLTGQQFTNDLIKFEMNSGKLATLRLRSGSRLEENIEGNTVFFCEIDILDISSGEQTESIAKIESFYTGHFIVHYGEEEHKFERIRDIYLNEQNIKSLRRQYRKSIDLPDPTKPRYAEVNRYGKTVPIRLDPWLEREIRATAASAGADTSEWMRVALEKQLASDSPPEDRNSGTRASATIKFSLPQDLVERVDSAAKYAGMSRSAWIRRTAHAAITSHGLKRFADHEQALN